MRATVLIALALALVVGLIIRSLVRSRRSGGCACSGGCAECKLCCGEKPRQ